MMVQKVTPDLQERTSAANRRRSCGEKSHLWLRNGVKR